MKKLLFPVILLVALASCGKDEPKVPELRISRENIEMEATGGEVDVNVTANVSWSASSSASGWVTVSPASGIDNGTIKITIAENNSLNPRVAKVTVKSETIEKVIEVEQDGLSKEEFLSGSKWELISQGGDEGYNDLVGAVLEFRTDKSAVAILDVELEGLPLDKVEGVWRLKGEKIEIEGELLGMPTILTFEILELSDKTMKCQMSDNLGFLQGGIPVILEKK